MQGKGGASPRRFAAMGQGAPPPPPPPPPEPPAPLITPRTAASMQALVVGIQEKMDVMRVRPLAVWE